VNLVYREDGRERKDKDRLNLITRRIIGARGGCRVERGRPLPVVSTEVKLDCGLQLELAGEDKVVVEVQAIERLTSIQCQLLSYLRVCGNSVGLIINFPVRLLTNSVKGIVNEFPDSARSAVRKKAENRSDL